MKEKFIYLRVIPYIENPIIVMLLKEHTSCERSDQEQRPKGEHHGYSYEILRPDGLRMTIF